MIGNKETIVSYLINEDKEKLFEIKDYKKKRSKDQNSYYWILLNQLSLKLKIPSQELHIENLRKYAPMVEYLVPDEADLRGIQYCDIKGKIEKSGKTFKIVRVYTGSHLLTTDEMITLLDNLIDECKKNGIPTITSKELEEMRRLEIEQMHSFKGKN